MNLLLPSVPQEAPPCEAPSKARRRFDIGQFLSRGFNLTYIFTTCCWIVFRPFTVNSWGMGARALWLVSATLGYFILVQGLKYFCYFPRPGSKDTFCWGRRPHSGFPSGHTLPAFVGATLIWQSHPHFWFWFVGALLIAWARWHVKAHFGYQVILSALIGTGWGLIMGQFL